MVLLVPCSLRSVTGSSSSLTVNRHGADPFFGLLAESLQAVFIRRAAFHGMDSSSSVSFFIGMQPIHSCVGMKPIHSLSPLAC